MSRIIERRGDQVWVEVENWDGSISHEWQHDPVTMCACGKKTYNECSEVGVTTFTETYKCGFVYRYNNANNLPDRFIK